MLMSINTILLTNDLKSLSVNDFSLTANIPEKIRMKHF